MTSAALPGTSEPISLGKAERARAVDRGHAQRRRGGQRGGVAGSLLREQRRRLHLGPEVEPIVARGAVGAERDVDAGVEQRRDGADAARELQVRAGAMHDARARRRQQIDLGGVQLRRVHADQSWASRGRARRAARAAAGPSPRPPRRPRQPSRARACGPADRARRRGGGCARASRRRRCTARAARTPS